MQRVAPQFENTTPFSEFMTRRLWQPLGAEADATWNMDSKQSGFEKLESVWVPVIRFGMVSRLRVSAGCLGARVCGSRPVIAARARSRRLGTRVSKEPAPSGLRRELVLVDHPAEQVTAAQAIEVDHVGEWLLVAERRPLPQCPVRPMLVEMPDVCGEHVVEVAAAEDQELVEAFAADAADPSAPRALAPSAPVLAR
jgi:hypothetical protein